MQGIQLRYECLSGNLSFRERGRQTDRDRENQESKEAREREREGGRDRQTDRQRDRDRQRQRDRDRQRQREPREQISPREREGGRDRETETDRDRQRQRDRDRENQESKEAPNTLQPFIQHLSRHFQHTHHHCPCPETREFLVSMPQRCVLISAQCRVQNIAVPSVSATTDYAIGLEKLSATVFLPSCC